MPVPDMTDADGRSFVMETTLDNRYEVLCHTGVLSTENRTLARLLRPDSPILVVTTPSVDRLYGVRIRRYFTTVGQGDAISFLVLGCTEADKSIEQVLAVCEAAAKAGLARQSQIVCFGGGVALDIVGLAATLFRRGIPHVRVPTTLIGMIDAGIGVKNAVNFAGAKSMLGTFTPPEACIVDPSFLATLPRRHVRCGLAEMIKTAVMCSPALFDLLEAKLSTSLSAESAVVPELDAEIELSIHWTLRELSLNLFERKELFADRYARKLDFGHSFSPHIEMALNHDLLHGEAVAVDIAICAELARRLAILDETSCTRVLDLLLQAGLPIHCDGIDPLALHASLRTIAKHRDGKLNLALPDAIGDAVFLRSIDEVSPALLSTVWQDLSRMAAARSMVLAAPAAALRAL